MIRDFAEQLASWRHLDPATWGVWIAIIIRFTIVATVFVGIISLVAMFSIWWERKVAGHIQSRVGPMHVGGWHGWAQSLADGIKLILKEDLMPSGADGFLFKFAPYIAFTPVFAAFLALPFAPLWVFEPNFNIGVLYLLAVLAVEAMGVIMAGWGSNSKWAIYGAMREVCQMVSYEIPLGVSILCGVLVAGTLNLVELSYLQGGGIWDWFIFHSPLMFAAFMIYFVASLASNKRAPFDLPESESELVAGFHTEYSGIRWSFFFFAEYGAMFIVGAIQTTLFLGGWNSPLGDGFMIGHTQWLMDPVYWFVGYDPVHAGQVYMSGALDHAVTWTDKATMLHVGPIGLLLVHVWGAVWFTLKAMTVIWVQIWLRWTLPRIRIDQVLHACVKVLLPLSLAVLAGVAVWIAVVPQPQGAYAFNSDIHGHWSESANTITRLGHLASETPTLQKISQIATTAFGLLIVASFVLIMALGWMGVIFKHKSQPFKTLYPDVMPVGRTVPFTRGPQPQAETEPVPEPA